MRIGAGSCGRELTREFDFYSHSLYALVRFHMIPNTIFFLCALQISLLDIGPVRPAPNPFLAALNPDSAPQRVAQRLAPFVAT